MGKVYACADLHGNYALWTKIKDFLKEDDTLYFLGDAIDRGPDGIKILKEMLADKRVNYLKGNHEEFLERYYEEERDGETFGLGYIDWLYNGGFKSFEDFSRMSEQEKKELYLAVRMLPLYDIYYNKDGKEIVLSHAGIASSALEHLKNAEWEYEGKFWRKRLLWGRDHFLSKKWDDRYENIYVVHGHTPAKIAAEKKVPLKDVVFKHPNGALHYYNGHKIDIDMSTASTSKACLLDLDTFEEHYFYDLEKLMGE